MDNISQITVKNILQKYGLKPNKTLGQNFLTDKNVLKKIVDTSCLSKDETVLEIGPGIGILTRELAENSEQVIAVEKDRNIVNVLKEVLSDKKNVEIENCDILEFLENQKLKAKSYKVVANIPYYLTAVLIRTLLESANQPEEIVLLIQKEVAQRICEKPPNMTLLSVSVQFYAEPKIISYVSKNCFWPSPKVDSAIIKITPYKNQLPIDRKLFFKVVKAGFSHPRKQLLGNLSKSLEINKADTENWLKKNNINPKQRSETLTIKNWISLAKTLPTNLSGRTDW